LLPHNQYIIRYDHRSALNSSTIFAVFHRAKVSVSLSNMMPHLAPPTSRPQPSALHPAIPLLQTPAATASARVVYTSRPIIPRTDDPKICKRISNRKPGARLTNPLQANHPRKGGPSPWAGSPGHAVILQNFAVRVGGGLLMCE